jgi:2-methylcitrate dehydratase PrpD
LFGYNAKTSLFNAAVINGISSHTAELDDGVISAIIHPGAPVFTALLLIAEKEKIKWEDFCVGVVVGYESSCRIANAIQPAHKALGYHATGTCGSIGVAMGIAAMMHYSEVEMKKAMSCAMASSHGTLKVLEDVSELKPFNVGSAVMNGIVAALMAKTGFVCPNDSFEGKAGFFSQMTTEVDYDELFRNDKLVIEDVYFKPYASCRYTHPAIECALKIRKESGFSYDKIEHIEIETYSLAVENHNHVDIPNSSSAKMSIPYAAAVAIISGKADAISFTDEFLLNQEVQALTRKIKVIPNDEYNKQFPVKSIASMTVIMEDGQKIWAYDDTPKGEPSNQMTKEEIKDKFISSFRFAGRPEKDAKLLFSEICSDNPSLLNIIKFIE